MTDSTPYSDEVLIQRLQQSDEGAFTIIFKKYWKELYYDAQAMLHDEALADDCVQEVFLSLWRRRAEAEIKYLRAYLKKSVRFQVLWLIRDQKISKDVFNRISKTITERILDDPYLMKELDYLFKDVLSQLPSDLQEIFKMVRNEGLSYKEIAERKGLSVKSVERKMSQSLKHFRTKLGDALHSILLSTF
jgi:RNA polymerase sigma-70 factor (ECF subfamily)